MSEISAETTYLFRHVVLREAAYELQLPTARASLHGLAARICIDLYDQSESGPVLEFVAEEIVRHLALDVTCSDEWSMRQRSRFLEKAAVHAAAQYRGADAVRYWRELAGISPASQRSLALYRAGCAAREMGVGAEVAVGLLQDALAGAEPTGPASDGMIRATLGFTLRQCDRPQEGTAMLQDALARCQAAGDRHGEALALQYLSTAQRDAGLLDEARGLTEQAVQLHRLTGNRRGEGLALGDLGIIHNNGGKLELAISYFRQALAVFGEIGDARAAAIYMGGLGAAYSNLNRFGEAEEAFNSSIAGHRRVGNARGLSIDMINLSRVLFAGERLLEARRLLDDVLAQRMEVGSPWLLDSVHTARSELLLKMGNVAEALKAAEMAIRFARLNASRLQLVLALMTLQKCLLRDGRVDDARAVWQQTVESAAELPEEVRQVTVTSMRKACEQAGIPPFTSTNGD